MKIVFLDAATLGDDLSYASFEAVGEVVVYATTTEESFASHASDADVLVINKYKLNRTNLARAPRLRLICIAATGFDNVDLEACRQRGIAVCNVIGYSTRSVAQVTVSMALSLMTHLEEYSQFVRDGSYTAGGIANRLTPVYHEIAGKTWGILGYGHIGKSVAAVAEALGCRVIACRQTPDPDCVDLDTLCRESDIISIHTPLNNHTRGLLDAAHIAMLKPHALVINVARGAVADEEALARAIEEERIGGIGIDVYSIEPMPSTHPFYRIKERPNVCLTPHMAWGGFETRVRLLDEMAENIRAFQSGIRRNRVD